MLPALRTHGSGRRPGVTLVRWCLGASVLATMIVFAAVMWQVGYVFFARHDLPDLGAFERFEFPTTGHVYDATGRPLHTLARERREITRYPQIPEVVRDAVLSAEDKRFFEHSGIDYFGLPRVLSKLRVGVLFDEPAQDVPSSLFAQGGSTITQQLVRGVFLSALAAGEKSDDLRQSGLTTRLLALGIGARSVNMLVRKREEMRLSLWLEQEMEARFGSKRRAKEEILARYMSFVYMGSGQYGFASAAEYYFGRRLATFGPDDVSQAAVLAGITKSPRDYSPSARNDAGVVRRRDQTLMLMVSGGLLSPEAAARAQAETLDLAPDAGPMSYPHSVVSHVLDELPSVDPTLGLEDLLQGLIDVHTTVDLRVQAIVDAALERGLERYEGRHPDATGRIQGSVVVLLNRDGRILAETGGRRVFEGRPAGYSDYNRATKSMRQPGSAMKPIMYLAAFAAGAIDLDTVVPDRPVSVSDGLGKPRKWIANYDGRFKGPMPVRLALAESRNAVAIRVAGRVGIDSVLKTAKALGVRSVLAPFPTTALGASEMSLLELANAYRMMASGLVAEPYIIRSIARRSGDTVHAPHRPTAPSSISPRALSLIQEGLRGVVRLPTGTAHVLAGRAFPIAVMGKTGTTNDFKDAVFVGSTYGAEGITAAVRIGFDDNRSLGPRETGGRIALPVFQELMAALYKEQIVGAAPAFPGPMEHRITEYLRQPASAVVDADAPANTADLD